FIGLGPKYYRRSDPEVQADEWEDRIDVVTRSLQGLTVACARCHDHKYDPIQIDDYYALAGVFASTEMYNKPLDADREANNDGQAKDPEDSVHIVRDSNPRDVNIYIRGNVDAKGPVVERRFLRVLSSDDTPRFSRGSGRLELAEAIVSRDNPLTARVIVNRIWARYFGQPLVGTPSNFGSLGDRPTHPDLLDDLAVGLMESGWSLKWLHRQIAMSATYQQTSAAGGASRRIDQSNTWLSHANRKRLSVEAWRDAVLANAGLLDDSLGGESFEADRAGEHRRTVYSAVSRLELNPMLALFDFPDPNSHAAQRSTTTTPLQKLFVRNSPLMNEAANALGQALEEDASRSSTRRAVMRAYQRLYARRATREEIDLASEFLGVTPDAAGAPSGRWEQYASVLLAANELLFVD
ncbi:MAG: DUF1553 domain-containing protein, partial [Planctomycetota bacterium]